jgi:hypothetical protein
MRKVTCVTPNVCTVLRALMLAMLTAIGGRARYVLMLF